MQGMCIISKANFRIVRQMVTLKHVVSYHKQDSSVSVSMPLTNAAMKKTLIAFGLKEKETWNEKMMQSSKLIFKIPTKPNINYFTVYIFREYYNTYLNQFILASLDLDI